MTIDDSSISCLNTTSVPLIKVGFLPQQSREADRSCLFGLGDANLCEISSKTLLEITRNLSQNSLIGQVLLKNYSYEKQVNIRYSFDDWKTVLEKPLRWAYSESTEFDVFVFQVDLGEARLQTDDSLLLDDADHSSQPTTVNLQFCLYYSWEGGSEWVNNHQRNYRVSIYTVQRLKVVRRMKSRKMLPRRPVVPLDTSTVADLQNKMHNSLHIKQDNDSALSSAATFLKSKLRSFQSMPNFGISTTTSTTPVNIRHELDSDDDDCKHYPASSLFALPTSLVSPTSALDPGGHEAQTSNTLKSWVGSFF